MGAFCLVLGSLECLRKLINKKAVWLVFLAFNYLNLLETQKETQANLRYLMLNFVISFHLRLMQH